MLLILLFSLVFILFILCIYYEELTNAQAEMHSEARTINLAMSKCSIYEKLYSNCVYKLPKLYYFLLLFISVAGISI